MSDDRRFLVTGATGRTGGGVIRLLIERGHRVRALVHREDDRSRVLADAGAEVVIADLRDLEGVSAAVEGVTGAYFCYPLLPGPLEATVTFAQAATEAGVRSVVNMSQLPARREAASNAARQHWLAERLLDRTDLLTTHLRPTFFAELLAVSWSLRDGEGYLRLPFGDGRHAPIAAADQSRVIAAVLLDPEPHNRAIYRLHGPVEMDHRGIAEALARALSHPVHYEPISIEEFSASLVERGYDPHLVQHMSKVAVDYRNGVFAGTNDIVEKVGGRPPLSVEEFARDKRALFAAGAQRSVPAS
ncbi:NmrA family NAD(P)-binding protein [Amycolatopsis sp. NPDC004368]